MHNWYLVFMTTEMRIPLSPIPKLELSTKNASRVGRKQARRRLGNSKAQQTGLLRPLVEILCTLLETNKGQVLGKNGLL